MNTHMLRQCIIDNIKEYVKLNVLTDTVYIQQSIKKLTSSGRAEIRQFIIEIDKEREAKYQAWQQTCAVIELMEKSLETPVNEFNLIPQSLEFGMSIDELVQAQLLETQFMSEPLQFNMTIDEDAIRKEAVLKERRRVRAKNKKASSSKPISTPIAKKRRTYFV
jgi:hypothetical protein